MGLSPLSPIFNASEVTLDKNPGTLPNVLQGLLQWFQPLIFGQVLKAVVNFNVVETVTEITFFGMWMPYKPSQTLLMQKDGQREWVYFKLFALPSPGLSPDDILIQNSIQYRVLQKSDFTQYGYVEYLLIQDYTGSGPTP